MGNGEGGRDRIYVGLYRQGYAYEGSIQDGNDFVISMESYVDGEPESREGIGMLDN